MRTRWALPVLVAACEAGSIGGQVCNSGEDVCVVAPVPARDGVDTDPQWPDDELLSGAFETPPYLALAGADSVAVRWRTAEAAPARLTVGAGDGNGATVESPAAIQHQVMIDGLRPGVAYRYEVEMDGAIRRGVFVAPGAPTARMVQVGEFHAPSASPEAAAFADVMRGFRPHVLIESGDMVDDGLDITHWIDYLRSSAAWISNVLLLPAHSNHVGTEGGLGNMRCLFRLPGGRVWYATRYGPAEVLTIASERIEEFETEEQPWIRQSALDAHDGDDDPPFLLAAWHHPACSSNYQSRASTRERIMEDIVAELVGAGGVDLVLVGHDKYYERSTIEGGIAHVMTAAGRVSPGEEGDNHPMCTPEVTDLDDQSLLLLEIDETRISARAVRPDGSSIDEFEITR